MHINEPLEITIELDILKKVFILFTRLFMMYFGWFFTLHDYIFLNIIGITFLTLGLLGFVRNFFLIKMILSEENIETYWDFWGFQKIHRTPYDNLEAIKHNGIFIPSLSFAFKGNFLKRIKSMFLLSITTSSLDQKDMLNVKRLLIRKKIIQGDEYVWIT